MSSYVDIKTILYDTIHEDKKKSPKQIADEIGIDYSTLCRYALTGESGTDIPLQRAITLMKVTNNYSLLKQLNFLCEFIGVKIPFFKASRGDSNEVINDYQEATAKAINDMILFFKNPCTKSYKIVSLSLQSVIEKSVGAKKYIDKEKSGQLDIFE